MRSRLLFSNIKHMRLPFLLVVVFIIDSFRRVFGYFSPLELLTPLLLCLILAIVLFLIFFWLTSDGVRAAIGSASILLLILFFDVVSSLVIKVTNFIGIRFIHRATYPALLTLLMVGLISTILWRSKKKFGRLYVYMSLVFIAWTFFTFWLIFSSDRPNRQWSPSEHLATPWDLRSLGEKGIRSEHLPDIYYLIFDSYTSSSSLSKYWSYDNSDFERFLTKRGFFVAGGSRSAHTESDLSTAATLNMTYLKGVDILLGKWPEGHFRILELIRDNRVATFLHTQGYNIINLSFFGILDTPREYSAIGFIENRSIEAFVLNRTLPGVFISKMKLFGYYKVNLHILGRLELECQAKSPQPRFVYAHVFLPHHPYSFDSLGNVIPWFKRGIPLFQRGNFDNKVSYLDQLIYTNRRIEKIVDLIVMNANRPSIIVIQGDHGFRMLQGEAKNEEATTILNAYYFPWHTPLISYDMSPVNSFRLIFNEVFGTKLPFVSKESENPAVMR